MSINEYVPIHTRSTNQVFFDYIDAVDIPEIDYFAVGIQNICAKQSTSIMSSTEWQKHFTENQYAQYDPIRRVTLSTKRNILPFCEIDFIDNYGKEIMRQRARFGICNGIIFMERFPRYNYMITLGTSFSQFQPFDFIKKYHYEIQLIKQDLIGLVEREARIFLPKNEFNFLSGEAK